MDTTDLYIATLKSSLAWPPHWKAAIFRLDMYDSVAGQRVFRVRPHNPDWRRYLESEREFYGGPNPDPMLQTLPSPHLDSIDFDSLTDLDTWARVVSRLT